MAACSQCGTESSPGQKFCGECGAPLAAVCPACGTANPPGQKFCGECGGELGREAAPARKPDAHEQTVERRVVSVLFADLVGFTSLSESRDAEDTRALLSRYFETCERLIGLYGGTVEKFIGDAVMAIWGAPVAQEDDAERAVRTALDLVAAVEALGEEIGAPQLRARAGVLTGEAAVNLGVSGQGMVAGDLVNSASRVQSAASPGTVLVGEATRRATDAGIVYEDAGTFELKGKAEPVPLWRAVRIAAMRGGSQRAAGLEPPFVGRDRELRLVKELFHASAEERKAHLVSVVGIAGIGKSRLAWEFEKYVDGLADTIFWWRGRCLAYGEGVAFWALGEMVRTRADIVEGEAPESARRKLSDGIAEYVADEAERAWIEPRLAHLLGLSTEASYERQDLFGAWRLYFERLSEHQPAVLLFEDLQWADASLIEFIEYLLEWSRAYPLFVVTLARPELAEQAPSLGAGKRNFSTLTLEPLSEQAMDDLLTSFVPGLPGDLRGQILARAEGVPLYAVETVRMLLDRGLVEEVDGAYRPAGPIEALEVPETLHALVAARLDGLDADERRLLQDASVLGKTFTRAALAAVDGRGEDDLDRLLQGLVRKEVLSIQLDPRSPERGQYGFLQDLLRRVAYETLPKRERKARHLLAAAHLEGAFAGAEDEVVEVIASHHLAAYELDPDAEDAPGLRARASGLLADAGRRSASLGASPEAQRYFEQAAELAEGPLVGAELLEQAGTMAQRVLRYDVARTRFAEALERLESEGDHAGVARLWARLGEVALHDGRFAEGVDLIERAFMSLAPGGDAELASLAAERLARGEALSGDNDRALPHVEAALELAESQRLTERLVDALVTKALVLHHFGRVEEALALGQHALATALEHELYAAALRAYNNHLTYLVARDRHREAAEVGTDGIALARRFGERFWELFMVSELAFSFASTGRWDDAIAMSTLAPDAPSTRTSPAQRVVEVLVARGRLADARERLAAAAAAEADHRSEDAQERADDARAEAVVLLAEGRGHEALAAAERALDDVESLGWLFSGAGAVLAVAGDAALHVGDDARLERLLERVDAVPPGRRSPSFDGERARLRAQLQARRGEHSGVQRLFRTAERVFERHDLSFRLAVTRLEHAEWLAAQGRTGEAAPLVEQARQEFVRLEATPWVERAERSAEAVPAS